MIYKNLKIFFKQLLKHKLYTLVTVAGFAVSMAFVILLSVYVKNEWSVNAEQKNKDRIYRIRSEASGNMAPPIGAWLQSEIPEIESFTRIKSMDAIINSKGSEKLQLHYLLADSTFFTIFNFHLIEGTPETALKTRNSVVLTNSFARKMFGDKSPLGKEVKINSDVPLTVTAVVDDISKTSLFEKTDALINFRALQDIWHWDGMETDFGNCSFDLYFLAKPNTDLPSKAPQILKLFKNDFWLYKQGRTKEVILDPLEKVYFSKIKGTGIRQNSKIFVSMLLAVVFLILSLAVVNYLNLTIARSGLRVKEIAIRKLHGSLRRQLVAQYLSETVLLCLLAFLLAILLAFWIEPSFDEILQTQLHLSDAFRGLNLLYFLVFVLVVGLISGIIPALIITRINPVEVIKGGFTFKSKTRYSKILIAFQYLVVIVLIISTVVIVRQTRYLLHRDLGFNKNNIIRVASMINGNKKAALRDEFLKIPGVKNVSFVKGDPTDGGNNQSFTYKDKPVSFQEFVVDSAFFDMLKLKITPTGVAWSKNGIWLNRTAVKKLGLDSLPQSFKYYKTTLPVLGVVNDFHFRSLHERLGMLLIRQLGANEYPWSILIRIDGKNIPQTMKNLRETYAKFTQDIPVDFNFMDESIQKWYDTEQRTEKIVGYFALLAIILSVMGIFAMSIFYNQQKTKEIGIRKVNGATVGEIIVLLNKDFVKWVLIAFVIAVPVAWYAMSKWLENFIYKITLGWWIFALSGMIALLVALLTVSWHTFRAARRNPVESLRYE